MSDKYTSIANFPIPVQEAKRELIGTKIVPTEKTPTEIFHAIPCPKGFPETKCIEHGHGTHTYHYQQWVSFITCPGCGQNGFDKIEGVHLKKRGEGLCVLLCPKCMTVLDVYESVSKS